MTNFRWLIMAPKSTAEWCKKYRKKHKKVYQERDALRKRNYCQKMKANPIANKERLRLQRERKQKYQQRVKESIATATAANLVTEENDDSPFWQDHIRSSRKNTSKSPRKRKEVISALANKFKLRIKPTQLKTGRPKKKLTESEKEWLKNFLDEPDMSPQVEKITIMLGKLMVKASMSRNNIICGHSISQKQVL